MLTNTFHHIPGIAAKTEERLWSSGIRDWNGLKEPRRTNLSQGKIETLRRYIQESRDHITNNNPIYFVRLLPASLHWRVFPEFRYSTVYLDIETTGLNKYQDTITTIALYDGQSISHYVKGRNLDDFRHDIIKYRVIVSYNGKSFDVPFLENQFGISLDHAHIDLRYILASLGCKGGLKRCEIELGIDRGDLRDIDGYFAVLLWNDYQRNGNTKALETLLAYNIADVVNLEHLMVIAYNLKLKDTPFSQSHQLDSPSVPEIPFKADRETVERIKQAFPV
ncbi:MAG: exonuclease [Desulfobacterales bacterium S5133MH4]|nr:MAG: exonuclease [Desulfobacterales bacterium S5133MH4]